MKVEGDIGTVGITNHAQEQLGDVVFVDLPEPGLTIEKDDTMGAVESVKAASDIYAPVSGARARACGRAVRARIWVMTTSSRAGEVVEVNNTLTDDPSLVNSSPEADGWMTKVKLSNPAELDGLMDEAAYKAFCAE